MENKTKKTLTKDELWEELHKDHTKPVWVEKHQSTLAMHSEDIEDEIVKALAKEIREAEDSEVQKMLLEMEQDDG